MARSGGQVTEAELQRILSDDKEWKRARKTIPRPRRRAIRRVVRKGEGLDEPLEAAVALGLARFEMRYRWGTYFVLPIVLFLGGSRYFSEPAHTASFWLWSDLSELVLAPLFGIWGWVYRLPRIRRAEANNLSVVERALATQSPAGNT